LTDDVLRDLRRLQQYAAGLRGLLTDADAHAPQQAAGADRTGAVSVLLGPDGLPNSVRVAPDWPQWVRPEDLGAAVLEAGQAAAGQRLAAWTEALDRTGWRSDADRLRETHPPSSDTAPVITPDPSPRPLQDLAEDVLASFDTIDLVAAAPARGAGPATTVASR
jgi:hypothetical protein